MSLHVISGRIRVPFQSKIKKISRPLIVLARPSKIDYVISRPNLES